MGLIVKSKNDTHWNLIGGFQLDKMSYKWRYTVTLPGALLGIIDDLIYILTLGHLSSHFRLDYLIKANRNWARKNNV